MKGRGGFMDIAILSVLVLVIALFAIFLRLLPSPQKTASRGGSKAAYKRSELSPLSRAGSQYKSISIVCDSGACEASKASRGNRFLTSEAPFFPLPDCTSTACSCKYVHYEDRRDEEGERRAPMALRSELFEQTGRKERRCENGRRHCDWEFA
jgi:hypothetical protein